MTKKTYSLKFLTNVIVAVILSFLYIEILKYGQAQEDFLLIPLFPHYFPGLYRMRNGELSVSVAK